MVKAKYNFLLLFLHQQENKSLEILIKLSLGVNSITLIVSIIPIVLTNSCWGDGLNLSSYYW